jgi:hypothetical protein
MNTQNAAFVDRQQFHHLFENGQRLLLCVDRTEAATRFRYSWWPRFNSRLDLMEIRPEFEQWRDYWIGEKDNADQTLWDFQFYQSCETEWNQLENLFQ